MFTAIIPIKKSLNEQLEIIDYQGNTLLDNKIKILKNIDAITEIIIASDSQEIERYTKKNGVTFFLRETSPINEDSFSSLVQDVVTTAKNSKIIWSFATTPFIDEKVLSKAVEDYTNLNFEIYDSLITCSELKRFILDENGPLNFRTGSRHQSSQSLSSLYLLINGYFIMSKELNLKYSYPWGKVPSKQLIDNYIGFEIKDKKDFEIFTNVYLPNEEKL
ncbi:MAG: hypothetical protein CL624_12565 [Arcobacter sp.]|nr:hypothetical protein [Arcobacter sp.]|tara:strand:+ start:3419 stop:4075 length:657 start_codon:yes stop_codon:yes gene_type:complete